MPRRSYDKEAEKLLEDPKRMVSHVQKSVTIATIIAQDILTGKLSAPPGVRLRAISTIMDYGPVLLEEASRIADRLEGKSEASRKGKRKGAPAKNSSAASARNPWKRPQAERNSDGSPAELGGSSMELPDGDRPPE